MHTRNFLLLAALLFSLLFTGACGGGSSALDTPAQGAPGVPTPPTTPNPRPLPPPPGPQPEVVFDYDFIDLTTAGAFPSDLVSDGNGSLYSVNDATIPATVLKFPAAGGSAPTPTVRITAADLIDHNGTQPANAPGVFDFAGGLFGAFTGDLEIIDNRWLFVTVGSGNSLSQTNGSLLRLANLVLIDTVQGQVVQTVNLAWTHLHKGQDNTGAPFAGIPQSLPSQIAYVPSGSIPGTGRIYVAMSNGAGDSNGLSVWLNGTVQVWNVDFRHNQPLSAVLTGKAPTDATRVYVADHYNAVGLTHFPAATGFNYLILTQAGASRFDTSFVAIPQNNAVLSFLQLETEQWKPAYDIDIGPVLPATQRIAIGHDSFDRSFGVVSSQTFSALYIVDLSGLDVFPTDTFHLKLMRTVDIAPAGSQNVGSGFHPGIGLTPSSRTLVVSTFAPPELHVVALPADIEHGQIVVNPAPFDTADMAADSASSLGALVVPANNVSDAYVVANGTFDPANFFAPKDNAFVGTLTTRDGLE